MSKQAFVGGFVLGVALCGGVLALTTFAGERSQEEQNKALVMTFYDLALNQKDFERASRLIGPHYIQHNPHAVDGIEGLRDHVAMLKRDFPLNRGEIKRALAEGDLVALHVHSKRTPESRGNAIVDIFRVENGKVVEHWDVVQPVPATALNQNTMSNGDASARFGRADSRQRAAQAQRNHCAGGGWYGNPGEDVIGGHTDAERPPADQRAEHGTDA